MDLLDNDPGDQPAAPSVCERMHVYGSHSIGVLTFWNPTGPLSGPWLPKDRTTIAAMNDITTHIF